MQRSYPKIKSAGLGLAAISYDSASVLQAFAQRKGIQFPLLSDTGSAIIRRFGILNPQPKEDSPSFGIPYPGIYVLDAKGVVTSKYFEDDYKERDTAAVILMKSFGIAPDEPHIAIKAKHVALNATASSSQASMGQHLALTLDIQLNRRVHVYAPGVTGYIPINLEIAPSAALKVGPVTYPPSKILRLQAIKESVPVYEGEVRLTQDVALSNEKDVRPLLDARGNLTIDGRFRYQACDDRTCFLPENVPVHWTVHFEPFDRQRVSAELQRKPN